MEKNNLSHARRVDFEELHQIGVKVQLARDLGKDFEEALNDVHLSLMQTLSFSDAVKIFENSNGDALVVNVQAASPPPNP